MWCVLLSLFVLLYSIFQAGLKPHGFFFLKENIARNGLLLILLIPWVVIFSEYIFWLISTGFIYDNDDRSITRSDTYFKELFHRCGLHIYKMKVSIYFFWNLKSLKLGNLTFHFGIESTTLSYRSKEVCLKNYSWSRCML